MRTTRTLALLTSGLVAVGTLTACGGPDPLSNDEAKEVLLTEDNFPLDGYKRGTVEDGEAKDEAMDVSEMENGLKQLGEISEECQKALDDLDGLKASDHIDQGASVDFTKGQSNVSVIAAGVKDDGKKLQDAFATLGAHCDDIEKSEGGLSVKIGFDEVDQDDFKGTQITVDTMGQKKETTMGGRLVGENFVGVFGSDVSKDDVLKVADAQAKAIEDK